MIFIFPGQGAQYVGMGKDFYENFSCAKEVFHRIDEAIKYKLSNLILHGPEEQLKLTEYTQPALLAVSMAAIEVLKVELGIDIANVAPYVAGHSVGEYSALCAAQALSVENAAYLLKARGSLMHSAYPEGGGMTALLGVTISEVEEILSEIGEGEIANDNGGGQVIVSGTDITLSKIEKLIKSKKERKAIRLIVSGPFHSNYMKTAALIFQDILLEVPMLKPKVPIVSNVTANSVDDPPLIKKLLVKQIYKRVRWQEIILFLKSEGYSHYLEIGPGAVLSKMVRNIDPAAVTYKLSNLEDLKTILKDMTIRELLT